MHIKPASVLFTWGGITAAVAPESELKEHQRKWLDFGERVMALLHTLTTQFDI